MTTYISSQDPVTVSATSERTYNEMRVTSFRMVYGDVPSLRVSMQNFDSTSGDMSPEGEHSFRIQDLDAAMVSSPKMADAWDKVTIAVGLYYDWHFLDQIVKDLEAADQDATDEIADRATALAALEAAL